MYVQLCFNSQEATQLASSEYTQNIDVLPNCFSFALMPFNFSLVAFSAMPLQIALFMIINKHAKVAFTKTLTSWHSQMYSKSINT